MFLFQIIIAKNSKQKCIGFLIRYKTNQKKPLESKTVIIRLKHFMLESITIFYVFLKGNIRFPTEKHTVSPWKTYGSR